MKQQILIFASLLCLFIFLPSFSFAAITFVDGKWETSFDYPECTQHGGGGATDCSKVQNDGINWNWGAQAVDGKYTQNSSAANNPNGLGGKGFRAWVGDGNNLQTGTVRIDFPTYQKELWMRWYVRYEKGFKFNPLNYDKMMWIYSAAGNVPAVIPEWNNNTAAGDTFVLIAQGTNNSYQVQSTSAYGRTAIMGGPESSGNFICIDVYLKMDTDQKNGVGRAWIDGVLVAENTNVDWSNGNKTAMQGWDWISFEANQFSPANGRAMAVDYDDWVIYNTPPPNRDAKGNPFIGPLGWNGSDVAPPPVEPGSPIPVNTLFEDQFEDSNLSSRGWYDNTSPVLSSTQASSGSTKSLEFRFPIGATTPIAGASMRRKFAETEAAYVSYNVKYDSNWVGSQKNYHPHEFYLMTNMDSDWAGMAYTYLTAYIEQNSLRPRLAIQDGRNIDLSNINSSLVGVTENRSVAGCNGDSDSYGNGSCYPSGGVYWNDKNWFSDGGTISVGAWHKVEAYFKLNSIVNGKAVADGVMQYWLDGQLVMNHKDVMFRTAQNPDMKFNKFVIAPWIGDGSPIDQTFWVDNLTVATGPPETVTVPALAAPKSLRIVSLQ